MTEKKYIITQKLLNSLILEATLNGKSNSLPALCALKPVEPMTREQIAKESDAVTSQGILYLNGFWQGLKVAERHHFGELK